MHFNPNPILRTDSYKLSHFRQYPPGTRNIHSYIEPRGFDKDFFDTEPEVVFLGTQAFIDTYLSDPITQEHIDEAEEFANQHGVPFNRHGWEIILNEYAGKIPLFIEALDEGQVHRPGICQLRLSTTDRRLPWLTSYYETALLRAIWYPSTVATVSRECKKIIVEYLEKTGSSREAADFMLHDFGARGVSSGESAGIGGFAHIVNFKGTDTIEGILFARQFYGATEMPAFSIEATEHSTITSWGRERETDAYRALLENAPPGSIQACVSDSWDIFNAVTNIWGGELKDLVKAHGRTGGRLVVRPDSGDPISTPIRVVELLLEAFAEDATITETGYALLPPYLRVLQGDGIDLRSIRVILETAYDNGLAAENFVFGMGGGLLQKVNRDTLKFAMKACAIEDEDGVIHDVYKDPVGSFKKSKRGIQVTFLDDEGQLVTYPVSDAWGNKDYRRVAYNMLKPRYSVYSHIRPKRTTLEKIREKSSL